MNDLRLVDKERIVGRLINNKTEIGLSAFGHHNLHIMEIRAILKNTFGYQLVSLYKIDGRKVYKLVKIRFTNRQAKNSVTLPCMLPVGSITHCGHTGSCYLSAHCRAAKKQRRI